jgi:hypothetical protein
MEYAHWFLTKNGWVNGEVTFSNGYKWGNNIDDYVAHFLHSEPDRAFFKKHQHNKLIEIKDEVLYKDLIKKYGECPNYIPGEHDK